jgi:hypothetical protein
MKEEGRRKKEEGMFVCAVSTQNGLPVEVGVLSPQLKG